MKSPRFYKLIIAALVIINISTLAFFWLRKPPHPPKPGKHELSQVLELKGEPKTKVDALEKDHHKRKKKLMHRDHELHRQLFDCIGRDKPVDEILSKLDSNKEEIERMTIDFFLDVAENCNDGQKKKLRKLVQKRLNGLRPGRRGPPKR